MPIRVALDISPLGSLYRDTRTGIFRFVENLARGLYESGDCDLLLCSAVSLRAVNACVEYLAISSALDGVPFAITPSTRLSNRLTAAPLARLQRMVTPSLMARGIRKLLWLTVPLVERVVRPLTQRQLAAVDIYHATYSALPIPVRDSRLIRFMMVHDLVPTLFPDFCTSGAPELQARMFASLTEHDYVLCNSEATKKDLCGHVDIDPSRVFVAYPAAHPDIFFPVSDPELQSCMRAKYRIPDAPYILSVNTLEPRKNIAHVVRCFARVVQEQSIDDLHLVLVGYNGWNNEELFYSIENTGLQRDRVLVTGYVHDNDLAAVYSGALAFVYISWYEGFGLPVLEAMQCGVPVITSNTSSLPEVVGDAGILIDPADEDDLCRSMLALYRSAHWRLDLSEKSRQRAELFSWDRCTRETIAAYRWALAHRAPALMLETLSRVQ